MLKARIRDWFVDHPKVVQFLFAAAFAWTVYVPDGIKTRGGSAYEGP